MVGRILHYFNVKWLDNNSWLTWLEKSGNFICLESGTLSRNAEPEMLCLAGCSAEWRTGVPARSPPTIFLRSFASLAGHWASTRRTRLPRAGPATGTGIRLSTLIVQRLQPLGAEPFPIPLLSMNTECSASYGSRRRRWSQHETVRKSWSCKDMTTVVFASFLRFVCWTCATVVLFLHRTLV